MRLTLTNGSVFGLLVFFLLTGCNRESGFVPLFNGHDLSGWVNVNGAASTWTVRDGMIVTTGVPTGVLRTTEHYENFVLELEWRHLHAGGNAGLFVYSDALPVRGQPFTRAVECQIMEGNHGDVFAIQGATMVPDRPHPQGWMRCLPSEERAHPAGEWNHYRVESQDGRITLAVNGKVVSGGSQSIPRKGYIVLESEGSEAHFRNIQIKTLPSSNPPPEEVATVDEGFVSLYNGVDLSGWKVGAEHPTSWTAQDWILNYDGTGNEMPLWSEKAYGDFVLIADWRYPEGAEEGRGGSIFLRDYRIDMGTAARGTGSLFDAGPGTPGEWNRFVITLVGSQLSIVLNGTVVMGPVAVPGLPERGAVGLVGDTPIQFANLYIKALP